MTDETTVQPESADAPPVAPATTPSPTVEATPATATTPTRPNAFVGAFTSIDPARFGHAALVGLIAFAVAWALGLVTTAIALAGANNPSTDWAWIFEAPGQLIAASLAGTLSASTSFLGITISVGIIWLPLLFTVVIAGTIAILCARDEAALATSRVTRWILAGTTALVLAVLTVLIAAAVPLSITTPSTGTTDSLVGATRLSVSGASFTGFLGAVVLGTLVAFFARSAVHRIRRVAIPGSLRVSIRTALTAIVLYVVVAGILVLLTEVIVVLARAGVGALASIGLWLPTGVVDGLAAINLSPISLSGSMSGLLAVAGTPTGFWLPTTLPAWSTILLILADLVIIAFVGFAIASRRKTTQSTPALDWTATVLGFAAVGAVISILGSIALWTHVDASGLGDSLKGLTSTGVNNDNALGGIGAQQLSFGPAAWTFILFAIVGALVQATVVWASPALLRVLPTAFTGFVGLTLDRFAGPVVAAPSDETPGAETPIAERSTPRAPAVDAPVAEVPSPAVETGTDDTLVLPRTPDEPQE